MIESVLATCLGCGEEVQVTEMMAALPTEEGDIHIAWRHRKCGEAGDRYVSRASAVAIHKRLNGEDILTPEELSIAEWSIDLGGELTVDVFEKQWSQASKGFGCL
jgi:hypothetical protein